MSNTVIVAPLNWGLGHATRCIPIIRALQALNYVPIIASDGMALELLTKEFPDLQRIELPSYQIEYAKDGKNFKWKMLANLPTMIEAVLTEKKIIKAFLKENDVAGIISDNRLGVYSKKIPSVFITHQLNVLSGNTSWLSTALHKNAIKKFTECWVPDFQHGQTLSGKLGKTSDKSLRVKYIGVLSRFEKIETEKMYDLGIVLSGPEPQRTLLQEHLEKQFHDFDGTILLVKGIIESEQQTSTVGKVTTYNFMTSEQLELAYQQCKSLICRSGYTSLMDLAKLELSAFLIPTPGQFEQEYLARRCKRLALAPMEKQERFDIKQLNEIKLYNGFPKVETEVNWKKLFRLFDGK
jgi:UDP:flavonoid glycosyltransferase YjiC (YdhE family)